jgi:CheY-like chemotaxis protein
MPSDGNPKQGDKKQLPKDIKNEKLNILIAEDNQFNQLLVKNIITKNFPKFEVTIVENGLLVLEKMKTEDFDFILMDIQMPKLNGYDATKEIRTIDKDNSTYIIALTAGATLGEKEKCLDAGMNYYISKPIIIEDLLEVMGKIIN